jgi:hypothetical protein
MGDGAPIYNEADEVTSTVVELVVGKCATPAVEVTIQQETAGQDSDSSFFP